MFIYFLRRLANFFLQNFLYSCFLVLEKMLARPKLACDGVGILPHHLLHDLVQVERLIWNKHLLEKQFYLLKMLKQGQIQGGGLGIFPGFFATCPWDSFLFTTMHYMNLNFLPFYRGEPLGGGLVYQVCWGRISSCEEGKGISWLWGRILRWEKGNGKQYHLPFNIEAIGKNIKWGKVEGEGNFGEEYQDFKKWGWGRISEWMNCPCWNAARKFSLFIPLVRPIVLE